MPRIHRPLTLHRICILTIAQSMDTVWCSRLQHVDCPSEILADVIEELKLSKLLQLKHLQVLIRSNLRRLNLCGYENRNNELSLISEAERTQSIQDLDLSFCKNVTTENLCQLAQHLPNLKIFSLKFTPCNDEVLHKLGENCPFLETLDVTGCEQVTDAGFLTDKPNSWFMQLNRLYIEKTKMTKAGASFVLKTFQHLQYFDFPKVQDVITELCIQNVTNTDEYPIEYQLRSLDAMSFTDAFTVLRILRHCPFLSVLHLVPTKMTDSDLACLSQLKHLQALHLTNGPRQLLTYADGVVPVLEQLGQRLTILALSDFTNVDLVSLSKLCTSLRQLRLHFNRDYVHINGEEASLCGFGKLDSLEMACSTVGSISDSHILLLLGQSHSLRKLFLLRCPALTDDVFNKVLRVNPLKCFQKLHLEYCDFLTPVSVHLLFNMHNDVCKVSFYGCRAIQKSDCDEMKKIVQKRNLDVRVNWSNLT